VLEIADMVKTLERAIAEVERLPSDMQEKIGRELLAHVEKLRSLRADLAKGIRSLDKGARHRECDQAGAQAECQGLDAPLFGPPRPNRTYSIFLGI
jgi:hypothetical protein